MTRRAFLPALPAAALAAGRANVRLGCQTNAWPIQGFDQFLAVLGSIRRLGFAGFETSFRNLPGPDRDLAAARKAIEATGLEFAGVHIFLLGYDAYNALPDWDLIQGTVDAGHALGARSLVLSGRAVNRNGVVDRSLLSRKAAALDRAGRYSAAKGMRTAYHNHHLEFAGNGAEMEALLAATDPAAAGLLLDAGHAFLGGVRPVDFFARHHARIQGMHLRDFKNGKQVPLGQGEFDLAPLASAIRKAAWSGWVIAEEERPNDVRPGDAVVEPARAHLREIFGS